MNTDDRILRGLERLKRKELFDAQIAEIDRRDAFDATFGVETSRPVEPWEIAEATDQTLSSNARYHPTPVGTVRAVIAAAKARHEEMSFVDYGCGKGRVMLVASDFPFRKIIGVEFARSLADVARQNVQRYRAPTQRCHVLEVCCQDAVEFAIPDDAGFFYFYEPFSKATAERVLANIESSLERHPRRAILALVGKALHPVVEQRPFWKVPGEPVASPDHEAYDARLYTSTDG